VVNFDPPDNADTYVHRIGRTGRAGRTGRTILLLDPRDRGWLRRLERHTGKRVEARSIPTVEALREGRAAQLRLRLTDCLQGGGLGVYSDAIAPLLESGIDPLHVAAAAVKLFTAERPLEVPDDQIRAVASPRELRVSFNAGAKHRVRPQDVMGALCNEGGVPRKAIGAIEVHPYYAEAWIAERFARALPKRMPQTTLRGRRVLIHLGNGPPPANRPGVEDLPTYRPRRRPKNNKGGPGKPNHDAKRPRPDAKGPRPERQTGPEPGPAGGKKAGPGAKSAHQKGAKKRHKAMKNLLEGGSGHHGDDDLGGMRPFGGKRAGSKKKAISAELAAAIEGAEGLEAPTPQKGKKAPKGKRRKPKPRQDTKPKRKGTQNKPRRNKPPHG